MGNARIFGSWFIVFQGVSLHGGQVGVRRNVIGGTLPFMYFDAIGATMWYGALYGIYGIRNGPSLATRRL